MSKMNPDVKAQWIAALRSGEYKRGSYCLKNLDGDVDATGVLCELAVAAGIIPPPVRHDENDEHIYYGYVYAENQATGLPSAVVEWSGLAYDRAYRIAMKGDRGMSFNKLATYIEENL